MTTLLFSEPVRANHQAIEIQNHQKNCTRDFLWQQLKFGQQHAAAHQINPTRGCYEFLARCDAGGGQNAAVGRFT